MELFERIRFFSDEQKVPLSRIAEVLELPANTFHNWLNEKSQRNLWDKLPKILHAYHQLSQDWLYFEEGEMLKSDQHTVTDPTDQVSYKTKDVEVLSKLIEDLKHENKLLQAIAEYEKSDRLRLEAKVIELSKELAVLQNQLAIMQSQTQEDSLKNSRAS